MRLGHSVLFTLRPCVKGNSPSQVRLDHGYLLVIDGKAQFEYEHSMSSEQMGPRVNLTYRSQALLEALYLEWMK